MDGNLVHSVEDQCTPTRMAAANVPLELAHWYHTVGRNLKRYSEGEFRKVMQVRLTVIHAAV